MYRFIILSNYIVTTIKKYFCGPLSCKLLHTRINSQLFLRVLLDFYYGKCCFILAWTILLEMVVAKSNLVAHDFTQVGDDKFHN